MATQVLVVDATVWLCSLDFFSGYICFLFCCCTSYVSISPLTRMKAPVKPKQHVRVIQYLLSSDFFYMSTSQMSKWVRDVWFCFHVVCRVLLLFEWKQPENKAKHFSSHRLRAEKKNQLVVQKDVSGLMNIGLKFMFSDVDMFPPPPHHPPAPDLSSCDSVLLRPTGALP